MQTAVRSPQAIFMLPQRLLVPLFQRPYVWGQEQQWEPLWRDLERLAERTLAGGPNVAPHFLGAVVLQSQGVQIGNLTEYIIIDGQQRLTTIQLLLDAIHLVAERIGATSAARRLAVLTTNDESFCDTQEDRFKVWPTNRDRPAFNEVMAAIPPFDHNNLEYGESRMASCHAFFCDCVQEFVDAVDNATAHERLGALERSARDLMQLVVIQLEVDENAQEIFETLNARGSLLTAADLIKNFIFQRLFEEGVDVERVYHDLWQEFETAFWEKEVYSGTTKYQLSSLFLNHWLHAHTTDDFTVREVFSRFKQYALHGTETPMLELLHQIARASRVYRSYMEAAASKHPATTRLDLFSYRMAVLEADQIRIIVLWLLDPEKQKATPISDQVLSRCWELLETWLVRRSMLRLSTKAMNKTIKELIRTLEANDRSRADEVIEQFITSQTAGVSYLPDDEELRRELTFTPTYKRLQRSRLRMVLEAIEDHLNGYRSGSHPMSAARVPVAMLTIEHLMPQQWQSAWEAPADGNEDQRQIRIHQLGNLTLMRQALNSTVSNSKWSGDRGKYQALKTYGHLTMSMPIIQQHELAWTDDAIDTRTQNLIDVILEIWSAPAGYRSQHLAVKQREGSRVEIIDLITAGLLSVGQKLVPTWNGFDEVEAFVTSDGRIDLSGELYDTPSGAGCAVRDGRATNGWSFWALDEHSNTTLDVLRKRLRLQVLGSESDETDEIVEDPGASSSIKELQYRFWQGFADFVEMHNARFTVPAPQPQTWISISSGIANVRIEPVVSSFSWDAENPGPEIRVDFKIYNDHNLYNRLLLVRADIEAEYGAPLTWVRADNVKSTRIFDRLKTDITDEQRWPEYFAWLSERVLRMREVMVKRAG